MDDAGVDIGGFDRAKLASATDALNTAIAEGDLSGGVTLVWRRGEVIQATAHGFADIEARRPMARDTLFRIASMTKPITSVAALMLMEEGKFALHDPITRWAPEFKGMKVLKSPTGPVEEVYPAPREITFDDLFTHRAGLAYGFTSTGPIAEAHARALGNVLADELSPDAWMAALASLPLSHPPGERFHYGHSTDVLGFLVARMAGTSFRDFLIDRVLGPLGMADTDFFVPPHKQDRAAVMYQMNEAGTALERSPFPRLDAPPRFCGGGAGLVSTADDYLTFARMLLNGGEVGGVRLLKAETVALMRENRLTDAQREIPFMGLPFWGGQGFGLGLSVITDPEKRAWMGPGSKGTFSWPGAFGVWWQADPGEDMILIYLIQNSTPLSPDASQIATGQRMGARMAMPMWQYAVYGAIR